MVAFDVFEHLTPETIIAKLAAIDRLLRPGGRLLLRYPNGQSPFGLAPQNADATHIVALSRAKIEQYADGTSLETIRYGGVARPIAPKIITRAARSVRYFLRDLHMAALRFIYAADVELEANVCQLMVKRSIGKH